MFDRRRVHWGIFCFWGGLGGVFRGGVFIVGGGFPRCVGLTLSSGCCSSAASLDRSIGSRSVLERKRFGLKRADQPSTVPFDDFILQEQFFLYNLHCLIELPSRRLDDLDPLPKLLILPPQLLQILIPSTRLLRRRTFRFNFILASSFHSYVTYTSTSEKKTRTKATDPSQSDVASPRKK